MHRPELEAWVTTRRPLHYSDTSSVVSGRPDHVRAGSSLNWFGGKLAVLQDDASFIGMVDPDIGAVTSVALPPDSAGRRVFDGKSGKAAKPDYECSLVAKVDGGEVLIALGSGSTARRDAVAVVRSSAVLSGRGSGVLSVSLPLLYAKLRGCTAFSGSELNLEGAVLIDDHRMVLFQRGNGALRDGIEPVNSTCEIDFHEFWRHLHAPEHASPPELRRVVTYDLGFMGSVPLTFTDATPGPAPGIVLYSAGAEDSPDTYQDGTVTGATIGFITENMVCRGRLLDERGATLADKVEGIAMHPTDLRRAFICIDPDDATLPTELCEIQFRGPWPWLTR